MLAAMAAGPLTSRVGLHRVVRAIPFVYLFGAIICTSTMTSWMLMLGRTVIGLAVGLTCAGVPTLVSTLATPSLRPKLLMLFPLTVTGGQLFATFVASGWAYWAEGGWRATFATTLVLASGLMGLVWKVNGETEDESRKLDENSKGMREEGKTKEEQLEDADDIQLTDRDATDSLSMFSPATCNALIVGCVLHSLQQLSGANAVM